MRSIRCAETTLSIFKLRCSDRAPHSEQCPHAGELIHFAVDPAKSRAFQGVRIFSPCGPEVRVQSEKFLTGPRLARPPSQRCS
jgi:hypothetical protein